MDLSWAQQHSTVFLIQGMEELEKKGERSNKGWKGKVDGHLLNWLFLSPDVAMGKIWYRGTLVKGGTRQCAVAA